MITIAQHYKFFAKTMPAPKDQSPLNPKSKSDQGIEKMELKISEGEIKRKTKKPSQK